MNDLISRQAAIDAVNKLAKWYYETYHETRPTAVAVIDALMGLPSAQPDIVRCRECKYHDGIRCFRWNSTIITVVDDFCSNGERRSEDERSD